MMSLSVEGLGRELLECRRELEQVDLTSWELLVLRLLAVMVHDRRRGHPQAEVWLPISSVLELISLRSVIGVVWIGLV
ncbi:hypothetical protein F2Q69_00041885 [Brassica cretica]|uniref:Uncharacterized protein n=1 Tax=Brassica cretica TaxID=69181 RepID=A0A8S9NEY2_BRACR|nr:hypothetical protein F2Q69_00041885 [Brassica cretica]